MIGLVFFLLGIGVAVVVFLAQSGRPAFSLMRSARSFWATEHKKDDLPLHAGDLDGPFYGSSLLAQPTTGFRQQGQSRVGSQMQATAGYRRRAGSTGQMPLTGECAPLYMHPSMTPAVPMPTPGYSYDEPRGRPETRTWFGSLGLSGAAPQGQYQHGHAVYPGQQGMFDQSYSQSALSNTI